MMPSHWGHEEHDKGDADYDENDFEPILCAFQLNHLWLLAPASTSFLVVNTRRRRRLEASPSDTVSAS